MEERFGVPSKVTNVKDALRGGKVVLLEVVIETCPWTPKVWNTGSCTKENQHYMT